MDRLLYTHLWRSKRGGFVEDERCQRNAPRGGKHSSDPSLASQDYIRSVGEWVVNPASLPLPHLGHQGGTISPRVMRNHLWLGMWEERAVFGFCFPEWSLPVMTFAWVEPCLLPLSRATLKGDCEGRGGVGWAPPWNRAASPPASTGFPALATQLQTC